jgi:hypothetical protein
MIRTTLSALIVLCAVVLFGCSKSENANNANQTVGSSQPPASSSTKEMAPPPPSGDSVGVPECDDFITKYDACVSNKVPEMVRAPYKDAIAKWRSEWRRLAQDPKTRDSLVSACKDAAERTKTSMASFNCAW